MSDEQLAKLTAENARLRKRLDEVTMAYEASVGAFRLLAIDLGVDPNPGTRGRAGSVSAVLIRGR